MMSAVSYLKYCMKEITFITGNQKKADYLAKYLGFPVKHVKLDLDELQSLDLKVIVEHKVRQAYEKMKSPVIVEDMSCEFEALGGLPGPFIKYFVDCIPRETLCGMIEGKSRKAMVRSAYGYYDGKRLEILLGGLEGEVASKPDGDNGFGWDNIFIPKGYTKTRATLDEEAYQKTYAQMRPIEQLRKFLEGLAK